MSVYKEIPKYNFKDVVYKNDIDPETGEITPVPASQERYLFYRINKRQDLAGITIPLYEDIVDPETHEVIGTRPILQEKTVPTSLETIEITPDYDKGYLGLEKVVIEGLDQSEDYIDTYVITPTQHQQIISINKYIHNIQVEPVTSLIDNDIKEANIRFGVSILGVEGDYHGTGPITPSVSDGILKLYDSASIDAENPGTMVLNG